MVSVIDSEDGKSFPVDVRVPEASCLDDGADMVTLSLQFALQGPGGPPLGYLPEAIGGKAAVLPDSVVVGVGGAWG